MTVRLLALSGTAAAIGWIAHDYLGDAALVPTVHLAVLLALAYRLGRSSDIIDRSHHEVPR